MVSPSQETHKTLTIRVPLPWAIWIEEFRVFDRLDSVSQLIDRALRAYAEKTGFPLPPSDRLRWKKSNE